MTSTTGEIAKQIKLITRANIDHSNGAENILQMLSEVRQITGQNIQSVRQTQNETTDLAELAAEIAGLADTLYFSDGENAPLPAKGQKSRATRKRNVSPTNNESNGRQKD
jgi:hypothetical protein